jgi:hypothetical protein
MLPLGAVDANESPTEMPSQLCWSVGTPVQIIDVLTADVQ